MVQSYSLASGFSNTTSIEGRTSPPPMPPPLTPDCEFVRISVTAGRNASEMFWARLQCQNAGP